MYGIRRSIRRTRKSGDSSVKSVSSPKKMTGGFNPTMAKTQQRLKGQRQGKIVKPHVIASIDASGNAHHSSSKAKIKQ